MAALAPFRFFFVPLPMVRNTYHFSPSPQIDMKINWWQVISEILRVVAACLAGAAGGAVMS